MTDGVLTTGVDGTKDRIRHYWDRTATFYDRPAPGWQSPGEVAAWKEELSAALGPEPRKLLDVGTGTGFLSFALHELGHRMNGIDLSPNMLGLAQERAAAMADAPDFALGDAEDLQFPDRSFDGVVCRYALWTLPDPERAVREWARVVRGGGVILVIDGLWVYQGWLRKLAGVMRTLHRTWREGAVPGYEADLRRRLPFGSGTRPNEVEELLTRAGLEVQGARDLAALRAVQRRNLAWYLRYSFTWPTFMIWARVPEKP